MTRLETFLLHFPAAYVQRVTQAAPKQKECGSCGELLFRRHIRMVKDDGSWTLAVLCSPCAIEVDDAEEAGSTNAAPTKE